MSVAELKATLISKINSEDDDAVLAEWLDIMDSGTGKVYELPDELLEGLDELNAEVERGEYFTNEEVYARAQETINRAMKNLK